MHDELQALFYYSRVEMMEQDKREFHQLIEKTGNWRGEREKRTPDVRSEQ
jgi:hypothetical protein